MKLNENLEAEAEAKDETGAAGVQKAGLVVTWKNLSMRSRSMPVHSLLTVCRKLSTYRNSEHTHTHAFT